MAITQNPIIGRARNQAGGMIFSKMYDKNVIRAKPITVKNPKSPGQTKQREFIAALTAWAKQFSPDDLVMFFPRPIASRSRYSELQAQLSKGRDVSGANGTVDLDSVPSFGNGPKTLSGSVSTTVDSTDVTVDFSGLTANDDPQNTDSMTATLFNKTNGQIHIAKDAGTWSVKTIVIGLPGGWLDTDDVVGFVTKKNVKFKPGGELAESVQ